MIDLDRRMSHLIALLSKVQFSLRPEFLRARIAWHLFLFWLAVCLYNF